MATEERPAPASQRVDDKYAITTTIVPAFDDELHLIEALRRGEEAAFL